MKSSFPVLLGVLQLPFVLFAQAEPITEDKSKPNVLLIYADDVGYGDLGSYGSKLIPTPNLDRLAAEGLRFTDGHCGAATCSPSRFSLLTGQYAFRKGVGILPPDAPLCIPTSVPTLPKVFKQAGYNTAVIGKWHLGLGAKGIKTDWNGEVKPGPLEIGFDYSFLLPSTNDRVPCVYLENHHVVNNNEEDPIFVGTPPKNHKSTVYPNGRKDKEAMTYYQSTHGHNNSVINGIGRIGTMVGGKGALWDDEGMADVFVEKAREYLSQEHERPFFMYFSSQDIHVPRTPHPRFQGKTDLGYRGDAMVQLDWTVGALMEVLREKGLEENTIVIFSSDNGPVYDDGYDDGTIVKKSHEEVDQGHDGSGPYRGGKYQVYEGGTRVPFLIKWPGKIEPGVSSALVTQVDFLASFAKLLNVEVKPSTHMDSRDTLEAFLGDPEGRRFLLEEAKAMGVRKGPWKLVLPWRDKNRKKPELYQLIDDPSEQNNIADKHPEVVKELRFFYQAEKNRKTSSGTQ